MSDHTREHFVSLAAACRRQAAVASTEVAAGALRELANDYERKARRIVGTYDEYGKLLPLP